LSLPGGRWEVSRGFRYPPLRGKHFHELVVGQRFEQNAGEMFDPGIPAELRIRRQHEAGMCAEAGGGAGPADEFEAVDPSSSALQIPPRQAGFMFFCLGIKAKKWSTSFA